MNVLMVTIGYPPEQVGGTEIYVAGLVEELRQRGHACTVAYLDSFAEPGGPEVRIDSREHEGIPVRIVRANTARFALESMVFDATLRKVLLGAFNELADSIRPHIVHFHPLQLGLDSYLIESFHHRGLRTVLTHHSSNTSCARGDLVYGGRRACDGELRRVRCTRCFLQWTGVPGFVAAAFALPPPGLYAAIAGISVSGRHISIARSESDGRRSAGRPAGAECSARGGRARARPN